MSEQYSYQLLEQFHQPKDFRGKSPFLTQLWWLVQATLFAWSPQFMFSWRRFLLRLFGAHIGKGVRIRPSVRTTYPWKLTIGDFSWIGDDVNLYTLGKIDIGKNVVISQSSYLCTGGHDYSVVSFDIYERTIKIYDEVWIATDVFVGPGVTIGKGTVVGVRSTVLCDLPAGKICYGSPAKPVKDRPIRPGNCS